jgi:hypothetical protein
MPSVLSTLFRRPPGSGWLVTSGGCITDDLIARALALVEHAGNVVVVVPSPAHLSAAETALESWADISGWDGCVVDCESSGAIEDALSEAALAVLPDLADPETYSRALGQTDACEFLLAALDAGVVIVADGPAAEALGDRIAVAEGSPAGKPALRWIPGAIIQTHFSGQPISPAALKRKDLFRIGLPEGVAIASGPAEEREIWGDGKPTITLNEWWTS